MTIDSGFISLGKYSDALIQYFVGQLPSSPIIANMVLDEEVRRLFDVLPYIEILNKFIQSRHTETLLFSDLTKILTFFEERQKEGAFPIIIPQGLDITSEEDLEWTISAIRFHLIEEMKEFIRLIIIINIPWDQIIQKGIETSSNKIRKYVESLLDQFIKTPSLELKNTMKTQIIMFFNIFLGPPAQLHNPRFHVEHW